MTFTKNKKRVINSKYKIGNNEYIKKVSTSRDLGILFDDKLDFQLHIERIISKAYQMLGLVLRTAKVF